MLKVESSMELMSGAEQKLMFTAADSENEWYRYNISFEAGGYCFEVNDCVKEQERSTYFTRTIYGYPQKVTGTDKPEGIRFPIAFPLENNPQGTWRFCFPSIHYTRPEGLGEKRKISYMEDRLTGNMLAAYDCKNKKMFTLHKIIPAEKTEAPTRKKGENRYLHKTEHASLGYKITEEGQLKASVCWPYCEEDKSAALNALETPVYAYYPLDGKVINIILCYCLDETEEACFTDGIYNSYKKLSEAYMCDVVRLPFSAEDSIQYRMTSLGKSYREFDNGNGAGFFFHFDPQKGYASMPSGFSTSYETIPHDTYTHILEYGFTGRQINAAFMLDSLWGGEWEKCGAKVVDFYIEHCVLENGFFYSLYDLNTKAAFFSCGDETAPKLHYISRRKEKGNYLRTMAEPANDILDYYAYKLSQGEDRRIWLNAVLSFAGFLISAQNSDGSFYRAYRPDGRMADIGGDELLTENQKETGRKAATAIPIVFLCNLCTVLDNLGLDSSQYTAAAQKAADYTMKSSVAEEHYQGGTLDNPNVVDKEASQYVMAGLFRLYEYSGIEKYAKGAYRAAQIFVTWNYIWNAPMQPGTFLYEKNFKTKGMGAINSKWGGGVTDIYSLFHIRELYLIGKKENENFLCEMAGWIAAAAQQILSYPEDTMGFADNGMQPEGFGICPQGEDDGQIAKGDIWGTLGWIYSAGIYGLKRYLDETKNK